MAGNPNPWAQGKWQETLILEHAENGFSRPFLWAVKSVNKTIDRYMETKNLHRFTIALSLAIACFALRISASFALQWGAVLCKQWKSSHS
jgi:hypothetical protein